MYLLRTDDAYGNIRLLYLLKAVPVAHLPVLDFRYDRLELVLRQSHLIDDGLYLLRCYPLEVLQTRGYRQPGHIQRTGTDQHLPVAVGIITVRAVLPAREDNTEEVVALTPCHDVHHRLGVVGLPWQGVIDDAEQLSVILLTAASDKQRGIRIVADNGDGVVVVDGTYCLQVTVQPLPRLLHRQHPRGTGLEVHVIGSAGTALWSVVEDHQSRIP